MTEIMNLPPSGFFFIVKHALVKNIPTVFFALQEELTAKTVSFQLSAMDVGLNIGNLNKILETLVVQFDEQHGGAVAPDTNSYKGFATSATIGEMV